MCYNRSYKFDPILRLNWIATGDQARPLRASWSLAIPDGIPVIGTRDLSNVCNATVIGKWETSVTCTSREANQVRSLTMCGK